MAKSFVLLLTGIAALTIAATLPTTNTAKQSVVVESPGDAESLKPIAPFLHKGLDWLAEAQLSNGGWGSGQHSRQDIRDPHAVPVDPATTAFAAMALLRAGNTPYAGEYSKNLSKALEMMLDMIEKAPNGPNITSITGTQPQSKLGQNIDVAMASQFLTKIKTVISKEDEALRKRVDNAISVCVKKLEQGQNTDGSYAAGGWAPVLQSAMATNALEAASAEGYAVDNNKLKNAKAYQRTNVDVKSGTVAADEAAGISLYALASTQRASVREARRVREELVDDGSINWDVVAPGEIASRLEKKGLKKDEAEMLADSYVVNRTANQQLQDDAVWTGFGNNGGEEFLSYMMTSEAMASTGENEWNQWHAKMSNLFSSIQNPNGSWSGHHCITSPVFCTAAVVLAMTADRSGHTAGSTQK